MTSGDHFPVFLGGGAGVGGGLGGGEVVRVVSRRRRVRWRGGEWGGVFIKRLKKILIDIQARFNDY